MRISKKQYPWPDVFTNCFQRIGAVLRRCFHRLRTSLVHYPVDGYGRGTPEAAYRRQYGRAQWQRTRPAAPRGPWIFRTHSANDLTMIPSDNMHDLVGFEGREDYNDNSGQSGEGAPGGSAGSDPNHIDEELGNTGGPDRGRNRGRWSNVPSTTLAVTPYNNNNSNNSNKNAVLTATNTSGSSRRSFLSRPGSAGPHPSSSIRDTSPASSTRSISEFRRLRAEREIEEGQSLQGSTRSLRSSRSNRSIRSLNGIFGGGASISGSQSQAQSSCGNINCSNYGGSSVVCRQPRGIESTNSNSSNNNSSRNNSSNNLFAAGAKPLIVLAPSPAVESSVQSISQEALQEPAASMCATCSHSAFGTGESRDVDDEDEDIIGIDHRMSSSHCFSAATMSTAPTSDKTVEMQFLEPPMDIFLNDGADSGSVNIFLRSGSKDMADLDSKYLRSDRVGQDDSATESDEISPCPGLESGSQPIIHHAESFMSTSSEDTDMEMLGCPDKLRQGPPTPSLAAQSAPNTEKNAVCMLNLSILKSYQPVNGSGEAPHAQPPDSCFISPLSPSPVVSSTNRRSVGRGPMALIGGQKQTPNHCDADKDNEDEAVLNTARSAFSLLSNEDAHIIAHTQLDTDTYSDLTVTARDVDHDPHHNFEATVSESDMSSVIFSARDFSLDSSRSALNADPTTQM
jgi:hypothetical protein